MKLIIFKRLMSFLFVLLFVFSFCITTFGDSITGENLFGYNASIKNSNESEVIFGYIMWAILIILILLLAFAAIYNGLHLRKEEKERKATEKPKLIIKKRFKK